VWDSWLAGDTRWFEQNLRSIRDRLTKDHGCALTELDLASIETIYRAFDVGAAFQNGQIQSQQNVLRMSEP
jgi:hypothetical protein